jgi:hypothetical protein
MSHRGSIALIALAVVAVAPRAHADPSSQPGDGDPIFINYMTTVFQPQTTEAGARTVIPLAHQVCDARAKGLSDVQAEYLVISSGDLDRLGVPFESVSGRHSAALGIVEVATLAYCPTYNNGNW